VLRIIIADDHQLTLEGIRRTLEEDGGFEVVGTASSGSQILPLIARLKPDLVLTDIRMPGLDGLMCLDRIRKRHPDVTVVILSAFDERDRIQGALRRGASAYIVKSVNPVDLPAALRQACDGTVYHALGMPSEADGGSSREAGLTERETTMLKALAAGQSNKAISKDLWVSEHTVKFHLNNIYRKLGVTNRTGAARYALEHGLAEVS